MEKVTMFKAMRKITDISDYRFTNFVGNDVDGRQVNWCCVVTYVSAKTEKTLKVEFNFYLDSLTSARIIEGDFELPLTMFDD